jgi:thiamine pyrophosphokinase
MEALLVTGGEAPPRSRLESRLDGFELVCAADSGLDILVAWGIEPDIIVGDMDSISCPSLVGRFPGAELHLAPRDKDETDTELGISALAAKGADRIVLAGGGGGRLDHLLAIRAIFERRASPDAATGTTRVGTTRRPCEWHTSREAVYLVEEGSALSLDAEPGSLVSVFPLAAGASSMSSTGLRWALDGLRWGAGDSGVSNVAVGQRFVVSAGEGDLLIVLNLESSVLARESLR